MPIEYHIDAESNIMHLSASGNTARKEWMDVFLEIKKDPERRLDTSYLLDYTHHTTPVPADYIFAIAKRVEPRPDPLKWAFVISPTASAGQITMFEMLVEAKNIDVRVFTDVDEGRRWLQEDGGS
jgi:hypothetical protein